MGDKHSFDLRQIKHDRVNKTGIHGSAFFVAEVILTSISEDCCASLLYQNISDKVDHLPGTTSDSMKGKSYPNEDFLSVCLRQLNILGQ